MIERTEIKKILLLFLLIFCLTGTARAQFFENLQKYIDKIGGVMTTSTTTITSSGFCFKKNLKIGDKNNDVKELQKVLALDKYIYPEGTISGYFGKLTEKAVKQFQTEYYSEIMEPAKVTFVTGVVGSFTIAKLNSLTGCTKGVANTNLNGGKSIDNPSSFTTQTTAKITTNTLISPKDTSKCVNNGVHVPICALIKTGQLVTLPNQCFVDQLGYKKICDHPCPCNQKIVNTPGTIEQPVIPSNTSTTEDQWSWDNTTTTKLPATTTTTKRTYPYIEKYGQNFPEDLWEDRLYYPRINIQDPVSLKEKLTLKNRYYDRKTVRGCDIQGSFKMCYDGTIPRPSGSVVITSPEQLGQYFTYSTSVFDIDYFKKNVIYFAYSYYPDKDSKGDCIFKYSQCRFDRVVYNVPDMDEIFRTGDTKEYNYREEKYDMIRPKFTCRKEGKGCSFECMEDNYMYDVIQIAKTSKRVLIDVENEERICKE